MKKIEVSAYDIAQRFVGLKEVSGTTGNPQVLGGNQSDSVSIGSYPKNALLGVRRLT
jgi:hypothetical protein